MQNWKSWLVRALPLVAVLCAAVAVREHVVAQQPGAYGAPDVAGIPVTEVGAGLASLVALLVPAVREWRSARQESQATEAQISEQAHMAALGAMYMAEPDPEGLQLASALAVHRTQRANPQKVPTPEVPHA